MRLLSTYLSKGYGGLGTPFVTKYVFLLFYKPARTFN